MASVGPERAEAYAARKAAVAASIKKMPGYEQEGFTLQGTRKWGTTADKKVRRSRSG